MSRINVNKTLCYFCQDSDENIKSRTQILKTVCTSLILIDDTWVYLVTALCEVESGGGWSVRLQIGNAWKIYWKSPYVKRSV